MSLQKITSISKELDEIKHIPMQINYRENELRHECNLKWIKLLNEMYPSFQLCVNILSKLYITKNLEIRNNLIKEFREASNKLEKEVNSFERKRFFQALNNGHYPHPIENKVISGTKFIGFYDIYEQTKNLYDDKHLMLHDIGKTIFEY